MRAHNQVSMTGNDLSGLPPVYMYTLGSFMAVNCIFENFDKLVVACNFGLRCFFYSSDYFVQKKTNMVKFDMVKISVFFHTDDKLTLQGNNKKKPSQVL